MAGWNEIKYITLVSPTRPLSEPDTGPQGHRALMKYKSTLIVSLQTPVVQIPIPYCKSSICKYAITGFYSHLCEVTTCAAEFHGLFHNLSIRQ